MSRIIHLDVLGGISGDMFAGAMLDLYPELADECYSVVHAVTAEPNLKLECVEHSDGVFVGRKFNVEIPPTTLQTNGGHHAHTHWSEIRRLIDDAKISEGVRSTAISIFHLLAEAEAVTHGVPLDDVSFHEVGAWDSIADVLVAACIIDSTRGTKWTMGTLPIGSGTVACAHGLLPVPAPAVARLLLGFIVADDRITGERITPTGAAILKHLNPEQRAGKSECRLSGCGIGFGSKLLKGTSNILRAVVYDEESPNSVFYDHEKVITIRFDVDDQTPEDLSVGLGKIRAADGVVDVSHAVGIGKKGRHTMAVQVLAKPAYLESVLEHCFTETTTLGLRWRIENRTTLHREHYQSKSGAKTKVAHRPNGLTAKVEMDDLEVLVGGHRARKERREAEERDSLKIFSRGKSNESCT